MRSARSPVLALLLLVGPVFAQDGPAAAVATEVIGTAHRAYAVLARSCSPCHSEELRRPKGNFGFALDLRRLARAGEYVVRGQPEASGLLHVIEDGSMPPPRSSFPPLNEEELGALRDWILDGAPSGPIAPDLLPDRPRLEEASALAHYTGHLHPLLIHFPIGLLLAAALAEIVFVLSRAQRFQPAAEYCLLLGTVGSIVATFSGWFFALDLDYTMTAHRWLGVATSLFALAACQLAARVRRLPADEAPVAAYRTTLAAAIVLLAITSHLGGTATWADLAFS